MEQIERINQMEERLEQVAAAVKNMSLALEQYEKAQEAKDMLEAYYGSDDWKKDYADDEAGRLPQDLKRGVLSENALWNVLDDCKELDIRLSQLVTKVLSGRG